MSADPDFAGLLRQVCEGDERAAAELVRAYEPELRRFIRFRLTDPRLRRFLDSLDICQSVLASLFVHLREGTLRELPTAPRQLARLMAVMAQHKVIDKARRHLRELRCRDAADQETVEQVIDARPAAPDDALARRELVHEVRQRLPDLERGLLDRWMQGDDWPRIAGDLGGSPEALRRRLSRSIDRAAHELGLVEKPA